MSWYMGCRQMRDRLIELIEQAAIVMDCPTAEQTADYLLANGVIVPPVKVGVGHKVYCPVKGTAAVIETKVYGIGIDEDGDMVINPNEYPEDAFSISGGEIGKTVFLTREEAERALRKEDEGK